jgi:hypothetical protein
MNTMPCPDLNTTATNLSNAEKSYSCDTERQQWLIVFLSPLAGIFPCVLPTHNASLRVRVVKWRRRKEEASKGGRHEELIVDQAGLK